MKIRRQTAERPFGPLKAWMGATRFPTRTVAKVRIEMSLQGLVYTMKQMMQTVGAGPLRAVVRA